MLSFIHVAKNVKAEELCWFGDVILDACCQNIASADEIWQYVVEMSVLLVTCLQRDNPRSSWYTCFLCIFYILIVFMFIPSLINCYLCKGKFVYNLWCN